jgi:hypothetical protein
MSFLGTQPTLTQVPPFLGHAHAGAMAGGDAGAACAARAAADDEEVEIIGHDKSRPREEQAICIRPEPAALQASRPPNPAGKIWRRIAESRFFFAIG